MALEKPKIIKLENITKIYDGGILANHNVTFDVEQGEIHALVGENGAGKSTLMKLLFGLEQVTSGKLFLNNKEITISSSADAIRNGIGMVQQHFMLVEEFTGSENMMLGIKSKKMVINKKEELEQTLKFAEKYGFVIDASRHVRDMSVGEKQKLEILKNLYRGARLLILDEPTAVLTPQETKELFRQLIELKKHGMTIIFISHKLDEVKQISDRITVLKAGKTQGTHSTADVSIEEISNLMVGRVVTMNYSKKPSIQQQDILAVKNLNYVDQFGTQKLKDVSLTVRNSEVVGIAGVDGNGQSELVEIITANRRCQSGEIYLKEKVITNESIFTVRKNGVSYVPADRMSNGCAGPMSIEENLIAANVDDFSNNLHMINQKKVKENSSKLIDEFNVVTSSEKRPIKSLSGGNIQKVIVAREFTANSDMLILDQPTRGIDVGAISFIHHKILEMRDMGTGILLVSADLNELIALSDKIIVMYKGEVVASLDNRIKVEEQQLGLYMLGLRRDEAAT